MADGPAGDAVPPERAAELRDRVRRGAADFVARTRARVEAPLTVAEIASLVDDDDLDDRVWLRLSSLVDYFDAAQIASEDPDVAAYLATRVFEWELGNGGLHQYFFNFPDPDHLAVVLEGYAHLGLAETRRIVEDVVAPLAHAEAGWRESLRDGSIATFFESYPATSLPAYDHRIGEHDAERVRLIRSLPEKFAR
jgi:Domain of unknown function (DUF4375)